MSAVSASPAAQGSPVTGDPVRALQHALYRAAKADPGRRFHALYDKIRRRDVLWRAWVAVRRNNGAPGIDKITLAGVEESGVDRLLGELASELEEGRYRPLPVRRVLIPKPGTSEQRPLSIPPVRDRIVQAAVKIVLEPVFEANFLPASFGFRPGRSPQDALQVLTEECVRGRRWVVETDIASCFSAIPHGKLMQAVEERVCDQPVLKLLRAGVMEDGQVGADRGPGGRGHRMELSVTGPGEPAHRRTDLLPQRAGRPYRRRSAAGAPGHAMVLSVLTPAGARRFASQAGAWEGRQDSLHSYAVTTSRYFD